MLIALLLRMTPKLVIFRFLLVTHFIVHIYLHHAPVDLKQLQLKLL